MDASQTTEIQAPGLGRKIGLAWAALAWEGLWPRLMPLLAFVALFIAAAHLDLFAGLALAPWVSVLGRTLPSGGALATAGGGQSDRRAAPSPRAFPPPPRVAANL